MKTLFMTLLLGLCPMLTYAITAGGWEIDVDNPTITPKLISEQDVQTYTGEMTTVKAERAAKKGFVFVLVPLRAVRIAKDKTPMPIEQIYLKQGEQVFNRVTDDSFLMDYDILPFTPFSLKQEKCKGTLLFEIPLDKEKTKPLSILYKQKIIKTL